jgi:hypothetical protein
VDFDFQGMLLNQFFVDTGSWLYIPFLKKWQGYDNF